jgi:hypothetical protein
MALAAAGTVAFTIGPAVRAWRQDVLPFLKAGEQGVVAGRSRLASGLVVLQLAFAVLLLAGAGLVFRSFSLADALDLGFNRDRVLLVTINVDGVPEGARATLLERMRERLRGVPEVDEATYARVPPKEYWGTEQVRVAGAGTQPILAEQNSVGPDYLRVLGMSPRLGRELTVEDRTRTTTAAVINEHLAQALWPGARRSDHLLLGPRRQRSSRWRCAKRVLQRIPPGGTAVFRVFAGTIGSATVGPDDVLRALQRRSRSGRAGGGARLRNRFAGADCLRAHHGRSSPASSRSSDADDDAGSVRGGVAYHHNARPYAVLAFAMKRRARVQAAHGASA